MTEARYHGIDPTDVMQEVVLAERKVPIRCDDDCEQSVALGSCWQAAFFTDDDGDGVTALEQAGQDLRADASRRTEE